MCQGSGDKEQEEKEKPVEPDAFERVKFGSQVRSCVVAVSVGIGRWITEEEREWCAAAEADKRDLLAGNE